MLFIAKYDASHYFLINSDYMPFKCGVDICFNKHHVRANLHDGTVNYYARTEVLKTMLCIKLSISLKSI